MKTGFTLIELITVVIILGILAAIATPTFINTLEKSRQAEAINILTRMFRGYKILLADNEVINNPTSTYVNDTSEFNPNESNLLPVQPGVSDRSWKSLAFEQNVNYEQSDLDFSYDFLRNNAETSWNRPDGATCPRRPPGTNTRNIAVAWRKINNTWITGMELFPIDTCRYIFINMDDGTIEKSRPY